MWGYTQVMLASVYRHQPHVRLPLSVSHSSAAQQPAEELRPILFVRYASFSLLPTKHLLVLFSVPFFNIFNVSKGGALKYER